MTMRLILLSALPFCSCATPPGSGPQNLSVAKHEAAAAHAARYNPEAGETETRCRINSQRSAVHQVLDDERTVIVLRLWTHYE